MDCVIVDPAIVEIDIARHESYYFYNRRLNGRSVVSGQRIAPERARGIVEANADAVQASTGEVDFSERPSTWTWTARVMEE